MNFFNKYLIFNPNKPPNLPKMLFFSCAFVESSDLRVANIFNYVTTKFKYGAPALAPAIIFFVGMVILVVSYSSRAGKKSGKNRRVLKRSMSLGALHGGTLALERLVDYNQARADAIVRNKAETDLEAELNVLLAEKHTNEDFIKLQGLIGKLEMSGKEDAAVKKLENAFLMARENKKKHEAYEIEMFLVEMLIYKGDFKKAFKRECLNDEMISDGRRPLYKAIIHIMLGDPDDKATKCWEEFKDLQSQFQWPPDLQNNLTYKIITNFDEFKKVVNLIKADIRRAKTKK